MVLRGRSFFSFAGALEADLKQEIQRPGCEHIHRINHPSSLCSMTSIKGVEEEEEAAAYLYCGSTRTNSLNLPRQSREVQTLGSNEISTWPMNQANYPRHVTADRFPPSL